jgi:hypothetical protein
MQQQMEVVMKRLASVLLVFSTLMGTAGLAFADNSPDTSGIRDLERQNRAGNPGG